MAGPPRHPEKDADERAIRRGIRGAIVFGVVTATVEMAVILWLMYC